MNRKEKENPMPKKMEREKRQIVERHSLFTVSFFHVDVNVPPKKTEPINVSVSISNKKKKGFPGWWNPKERKNQNQNEIFNPLVSQSEEKTKPNTHYIHINMYGGKLR